MKKNLMSGFISGPVAVVLAGAILLIIGVTFINSDDEETSPENNEDASVEVVTEEEGEENNEENEEESLLDRIFDNSPTVDTSEETTVAPPPPPPAAPQATAPPPPAPKTTPTVPDWDALEVAAKNYQSTRDIYLAGQKAAEENVDNAEDTRDWIAEYTSESEHGSLIAKSAEEAYESTINLIAVETDRVEKAKAVVKQYTNLLAAIKNKDTKRYNETLPKISPAETIYLAAATISNAAIKEQEALIEEFEPLVGGR